MTLSTPVVIAGAGIGGLTLAIALRRRGIPVRVLERIRTLAPVGAGLVLQPNAMAVLHTLGLTEAVVAAGQRVGRAAMLDASGRLLGREQDMAALSAAFGAPVVAIHRGRLHQVLLDALAALAPGAVELGVEVVEYEVRGGGAVIRLADGATDHADVLVGADGIRSKIRARMINDGDPIYSGQTSWRGLTEPGAVPPLERISESWGRGERFGMVGVGHGEIYWFAVRKALPAGEDHDARAELLARFGHWHAPVRAVLEATPADRIVRTDIADREPITRWYDGPVALLGDAAHPMTPNLGQGACQAIEDALALAEALAGSETIAAAFARYEKQRVARANAIVLAARRLGRVAQWEHPVAAQLRDTVMRLTPERVVLRQLQSMWGTAVSR